MSSPAVAAVTAAPVVAAAAAAAAVGVVSSAPSAPGGPLAERPHCHVFVCGEVNVGKSGVMNSFAGGIMSSTSFLRETFRAITYKFTALGKQEAVHLLARSLVAQHVENELLRRRMKTLAEHEICSMNYVESDLPLHWDMLPLTVTECPGSNDADDSNNSFGKVLENNIHLADLVVFVTVAQSALTKASEVAELQKVADLVKRENESGHHVQLAILVNKYDDTSCKDMKTVFDDIKTKIKEIDYGLNEPIPVFKYSSHKMLIENVIRNKLDLYLPPEAANENRKIFQSTEMVLRREDVAATQTSHIVSWQALCNALDFQADNGAKSHNEEFNHRLVNRLGTQEYHEFFTFIKRFQNKLHEDQQRTATNYLITKMSEFKVRVDTWGNSLTADNFVQLKEAMRMIQSKFAYLQSIDEMETYREIFFNSEVNIFSWMKYLHDLSQKSPESVKANSLLYFLKLWLLFIWNSPDLTAHFVELFLQGKVPFKTVTWDIHAFFARWFIVQPPKHMRGTNNVVTYDLSKEWFAHLLKSPQLFATANISCPTKAGAYAIDSTLASFPMLLTSLYEIDEATTVKATDTLPTTYGQHNSHLIHTIMNSPFTLIDHRALLRLATLPLGQINALDRQGLLCVDILDRWQPNLATCLRYCFCNVHEFNAQQPLNGTFFTLPTQPNLEAYLKVATAFQQQQQQQQKQKQ